MTDIYRHHHGILRRVRPAKRFRWLLAVCLAYLAGYATPWLPAPLGQFDHCWASARQQGFETGLQAGITLTKLGGGFSAQYDPRKDRVAVQVVAKIDPDFGEGER